MTEPTEKDPRDSKCSVNTWGKHKWARAFKDVISKTQFVSVLRCRYCARFLCCEFERVILPSGRVAITERAFEPIAPDATTVGLQRQAEIAKAVKEIENTARLALSGSKTSAYGAKGSATSNGSAMTNPRQ